MEVFWEFVIFIRSFFMLLYSYNQKIIRAIILIASCLVTLTTLPLAAPAFFVIALSFLINLQKLLHFEGILSPSEGQPGAKYFGKRASNYICSMMRFHFFGGRHKKEGVRICNDCYLIH